MGNFLFTGCSFRVGPVRCLQATIYNHFESKESLAAAIAAAFFQPDATFKIRIFDKIEDPAEAIAINIRHTLRVAKQDPVVAWVLVRAGAGRNLLHTSDSDELAKMISIGLKTGRFDDVNPRVAALVIRGAAFTLLQDILQGTAPPTIETAFAELVLRMLGVPRDQIPEIAARPDPVPGDAIDS